MRIMVKSDGKNGKMKQFFLILKTTKKQGGVRCNRLVAD
jgi:hypothetical protein